jgi:hypothetical protein
MQVRIVCEGRTDIPLLEQIALAVFGPCELNAICPQRDSLGKWSHGGWGRVKEWCQRGVEQIADEMAIAGIDVVIVHVDGDMCGREGFPETAPELCDHVKSNWLRGTPPRGLVICVPMRATDTWLAAAIDPSVNESDEPLSQLVRLGILQPHPDKPRKSMAVYQEHAHRLQDVANVIRSTLPELDRFMTKLEAIRG